MNKTFTCGETFSGKSVAEIMRAAGPHMMRDEAHKEAVMSLESRTGESQEVWLARVQAEFEAR